MGDAARTPVETVNAFMAAMEKLDYDTALTFVAADCEYENMPLGKVQGHDGIRGVLEPFFAPTVENQWIIRNTAVNGPVVMLERLDRHRLESGWVELPVMGTFEVRDGLITAWRDYFDLATIMNGFGLTG